MTDFDMSMLAAPVEEPPVDADVAGVPPGVLPGGAPGVLPQMPAAPPPISELLSGFAAEQERAVPPAQNRFKVDIVRYPARVRLQQWKQAERERVETVAPAVDGETYLPSEEEAAALRDPAAGNKYAAMSDRLNRIVLSDTADELAVRLAENTWGRLGEEERFTPHSAATMLIERYATAHGDTPEFDFAVFDALADSGKLAGDAAGWWERFIGSPERLDDATADQLFSTMSRIGDIFDEVAELADIELDPVADVERVALGDLGPMLFTKADIPLDVFNVEPISSDLLRAEAPPGRSIVLLGGRRGGLVGFPSFRNAVAFNGFTPTLVGVNDQAARWVPTEPASVQSVAPLKVMLERDPAATMESFTNTNLVALNGRHPGLLPEETVVFTLDDRTVVPTGFDWEAIPLGRTRFDMPETSERAGWYADDVDDELLSTFRTAESGRRFVIRVPRLLDPGAVADEVVLRGGKQVSVYAKRADVPGWVRQREHLYSDGVETMAVRSRDMATTAPHSVYVWTKPVERSLDRVDGLMPARQLAENEVLFGGGVRVVANEPLEVTSGVLGVRRDGRRVSRFGVDPSGVLVPAVDDDLFETVVSRGRDGQWTVTVQQSQDFTEAVRAANLVALAGGTVARLRAPRLRASFQQAVDVDIPA